jgi:hypothetical protein
MDRAVSQLLNRLDEFRASVRRVQNRALFEIPQMLADIMQQAASVSRPDFDPTCQQGPACKLTTN